MNRVKIFISVLGYTIVNVFGLFVASTYIVEENGIIIQRAEKNIKEIADKNEKLATMNATKTLKTIQENQKKVMARIKQAQEELEFSLYSAKLLNARSMRSKTPNIQSLQRIFPEEIPRLVQALSKVEITDKKASQLAMNDEKSSANEMSDKKNGANNADGKFDMSVYAQCQYLQKMANRCKQTFANLRAYKTIAGMPDNASRGVLNCPIPIAHKS